MPKKTVGSRIAGVNPGVNLGTFAFGGNVYFVDPVDGLNGNDGLSPETAVADLETAYGKCRDGENDTVVIIGTATAVNITSTDGMTWSKNYTHLVGGTAPLNVGQRARVIADTTDDAAYVLKITGDGCVFKNIQFYNDNDSAEDSDAVLLDGADRCYFENCYFAGMANATAAARTGSASLTLGGTNAANENYFKKCAIGLRTVARGAATRELHLLKASWNTFEDCVFGITASSANAAFVYVDPSYNGLGTNFFIRCKFINQSTNWATTITDSFIINTAGTVYTYYLVLEDCIFVGSTGIADTVTRVYGNGPAPNAGMYLSTNPTT